VRKTHQVLGLILLIPIVLWSLTGIFFLIKPGYEGAYQKISPKLYNLDSSFSIAPRKNWNEIRLLKTALGYHLIVKADGQYKHLNPVTLQKQVFPSAAQLRLLFNDAIAKDSKRYGSITEIINNKAYTDNGIEISLDWSNLTLTQQGKDTQLIRIFYKIHYMEWLANPLINKGFGALTIALLLILSAAGLIIYINRRIHSKN